MSGRGRKAYSNAKCAAYGVTWERDAEIAKYGELSKHVVFMAGAAQWVEAAGVAAMIQHPDALKEYDYRAARLGKWVAAWLLHPAGAKVLVQVHELKEFATRQNITITEVFESQTAGEPVFGKTDVLRDTGECERLDIPITIDMPPMDDVRHTIAWRTRLILKADPSRTFTTTEVMQWIPGVSLRTVERAMKALKIPRRLGRPAGAKDSPETHRQIVKGLGLKN